MVITQVRNNKITDRVSDNAILTNFELESHHLMAFEIP